MKSLPIWYLERTDSKTLPVTWSTLSCLMISMLSLSECITRSSRMSFEKTKRIATVNWVFHVSDFRRLFIMSFKYGLI